MPFAESTNSQEQPYKYNGKELDETLGLNVYDYLARQLELGVPRFTSMDPLAEKYYSISPYVYVANNPLKYIDPDGKTIRIWYSYVSPLTFRHITTYADYNKDGSITKAFRNDLAEHSDYLSKVQRDLNQLTKDDPSLAAKMTDLISSKNIHSIKMTDYLEDGNTNKPNSGADDRNGVPTGTTTKYNPNRKKVATGEERTPRIGLSHELLGHGWDSDKGKTNYNKTSNGIPLYEVNATNIENKVRKVTKEPKRTKYGEDEIPEQLLD